MPGRTVKCLYHYRQERQPGGCGGRPGSADARFPAWQIISEVQELARGF